jgi:hypothetical protein
MDEAAIAESLARLDSLAVDEYRMPLSEVVADDDATRSTARLGRLVGILLKEPFAVPTPREQPSGVTGAHRSWLLLGEDAFNDPERQRTWQYKTLEMVRSDLESEPEFAFFEDWGVWDFADYAGTERAFFWLLRSRRPALHLREHRNETSGRRSTPDFRRREGRRAGVGDDRSGSALPPIASSVSRRDRHHADRGTFSHPRANRPRRLL